MALNRVLAVVGNCQQTNSYQFKKLKLILKIVYSLTLSLMSSSKNPEAFLSKLQMKYLRKSFCIPLRATLMLNQ